MFKLIYIFRTLNIAKCEEATCTALKMVDSGLIALIMSQDNSVLLSNVIKLRETGVFMGTVHQIPTTADAHLRLLQQLASEAISKHPDPQVAKRWADMASETILRYPGPPMPSQAVLDLDRVEGLDPAQQEDIELLLTQWLQSYFSDVRDQLMSVHNDMLRLQKRVAELEQQVEGKTC